MCVVQIRIVEFFDIYLSDEMEVNAKSYERFFRIKIVRSFKINNDKKKISILKYVYCGPSDLAARFSRPYISGGPIWYDLLEWRSVRDRWNRWTWNVQKVLFGFFFGRYHSYCHKIGTINKGEQHLCGYLHLYIIFV